MPVIYSLPSSPSLSIGNNPRSSRALAVVMLGKIEQVFGRMPRRKVKQSLVTAKALLEEVGCFDCNCARFSLSFVFQ